MKSVLTPQQFRKIALSLPDAVESEHMGHPDFRVGGKVFASLGAPRAEWGMVKLTPEQQQTLCDAHADAFQPCNGAWGRQGYTNVKLATVKTVDVRSALTLAIEIVTSPSKRSTLVIIKRSLSPGFAGIHNPLFATDNALMLVADGRKAIMDLINSLEQI